MNKGSRGNITSFPLALRWEIFAILLTKDNEEVLGACYKLLTNQLYSKKIKTSFIHTIYNNVSDYRVLKKRGKL